MDRPTLGIIATSGDLFARELFKALSDRYHIEHLQGPDPYVDLVWCDWADQALVQLTRGPKHQPLIARLHSHEVFTGLPEQVRWDRVDASRRCRPEEAQVPPRGGAAGAAPRRCRPSGAAGAAPRRGREGADHLVAQLALRPSGSRDSMPP